MTIMRTMTKERNLSHSNFHILNPSTSSDRGLRQLSLELLVDSDRKSNMDSPDESLDNNSDASLINSSGGVAEDPATVEGCIGFITDEDQVRGEGRRDGLDQWEEGQRWNEGKMNK